jgi:hypothetical protein
MSAELVGSQAGGPRRNGLASESEAKSPGLRLLVACSVITAIVAVRDIGGLSLDSFVFVAVVVMSMVMLDYSGLLAYIAFLALFIAGLPANYIVPFGLLFLLAKGGRGGFVPRLIPAFALVALEGLHVLFSGGQLIAFLHWAAFILLVTVFLCGRRRRADIHLVIWSFASGVVVASTIMAINSLRLLGNGFGSVAALSSFRLGNVKEVGYIGNEMTLGADQNTLGLFIVIAIAALLTLFILTRRLPAITALLLTVLTVLGILTQSRTFAITLAVYLAAVVISSARKQRQSLTVVFLGVALAAYLMTQFVPGVLDALSSRFTGGDISGERIAIFGQYSEFMWGSWDRLVFGVGLQDQQIKAGLASVPHNGYQQMFVAWGFTGLPFVIAWLASLVRKPASAQRFLRAAGREPERRPRTPLAVYLPLGCLALFIMALQFLSPELILLTLIPSAILIGREPWDAAGGRQLTFWGSRNGDANDRQPDVKPPSHVVGLRAGSGLGRSIRVASR